MKKMMKESVFQKSLLCWATLLVLALLFAPSKGWSCSYDDPDLQKRKEQCSEEPYCEWDCDTNRARNLEESEDDHDTASAKEGFEECKGIEDDEERSQCFRDNAKEHSPGEADYKDDEGYANAAMGAYTTVMALSMKTKEMFGSACSSKNYLAYTGIGTIATEAYFKLKAEEELDELEKEYKKRANQEKPFEAQIDAFKFLRKREEKVKELADLRIKQYTLLSAAYAGTGIIALTETTNPDCYADGATENDGEGSSADAESETGANKQLSEEKDNLAERTEADGGNPEEVTEADVLENPDLRKNVLEATNSIRIETPQGVATTAAIGVGVSWILRMSNEDQKEEAEDNIEYLDEIIAKLDNAVEGTCPNGRDDYEADPACYCYTEEGERNPNRSKSEKCQNYWAQQDNQLYAEGGDYSKENEEDGGPEGCMLRNGQFDEECKCRRAKNSQGENACLKVPKNANNLGSLGNAIGTTSTAQQIEDLTNGNMTLGDLDEQQLGQFASRARKVKDKMIQDLNKERKKEGKPPVSLDSEELAKKHLKKMKPSSDSNSQMASLDNFMPASVAENSQAKKALEDAAKDAGMKKPNFAGGKGLNKKKGKKKDDNKFSFNSGDRGTKSVKTQDFMDKKYNYKENDIVKKEGASIWQIITHRYNTTGLKRLFPEEKRAPSANTNP